MARLYGKEWSRRQLLERVGDISQIAGTRRVRYAEGPEDGVEAIEFRTGTGFNFVVLPSRGLDIAYAEYRGVPLCWRSATGDVHPAYGEPAGSMTWLRGFYGGMLATCGLTQAGAPSTDQGESLPLHGRVNYAAARNVYHDGEWEGDEYVMWAYGRVREAVVFGENVRLTRRIWARLGESRLYIHDVVENMGTTRTPHMIAYHINPGFPVIDSSSKLVATTAGVHPRDKDAQSGKDFYNVMHIPVSAYKEKVYYHDMLADGDGYAYSATINHGFKIDDVHQTDGIGVYVRYLTGQLPYFWQWKMLGEGNYVVGMEPANCLPEGRDKERARGGLRFLGAREAQEYNLEIGVLGNREDIKEYEDRVKFVLTPPAPKEPELAPVAADVAPAAVEAVPATAETTPVTAGESTAANVAVSSASEPAAEVPAAGTEGSAAAIAAVSADEPVNQVAESAAADLAVADVAPTMVSGVAADEAPTAIATEVMAEAAAVTESASGTETPPSDQPDTTVTAEPVDSTAGTEPTASGAPTEMPATATDESNREGVAVVGVEPAVAPLEPPDAATAEPIVTTNAEPGAPEAAQIVVEVDASSPASAASDGEPASADESTTKEQNPAAES